MTRRRGQLLFILGFTALLAMAGCKKAKKPTKPAATPTSEKKALEAKKSAAPPAATKAEIGKPAPDFTLTDESGKQHKLSSYRGKVVVLEWTSPRCPFVRRHYAPGRMPKTAGAFDASKVVWLAVDSSHFNKPENSKAWKTKKGFSYPILQDPLGQVGRMYSARTTPHMFVVDAKGILRYQGAVDNDPRGEMTTPTNFVQQAVNALLKGQAPPKSSTRPYGCSVKYSS